MNPDKKKLLFVFNPYSGKAQLRNKLCEILDLFVKNGYEVTVHPTQSKLDARYITKENADRFDRIICSGGDGTINEVVDGLMECAVRPMIGYIPTGTVNDFASSLKLSKNILTAAEVTMNGQPFSCDVGSFNKEYFTYIAAFGLFTDVPYLTPQQTKNFLGRQAYLLEGMKRLTNIQSYHMRLETEDTVIEDSFIFGMVTNSTSVGGFKSFGGRGVKLNDGLFEVTLIKMPQNPLELQSVINSLLTGAPNVDLIHSFRSAKLHITSEVTIEWTLDGEFGGSESDVVIENHKQAVQIMTSVKEKKTALEAKK